MSLESTFFRFLLAYLPMHLGLAVIMSLLDIGSTMAGVAALMFGGYWALQSFASKNGRLMSAPEKRRFVVAVCVFYLVYQSTLGVAYVAYQTEMGMARMTPMLVVWVLTTFILLGLFAVFTNRMEKSLVKGGVVGEESPADGVGELPPAALWVKLFGRGFLVLVGLLALLVWPAAVLAILAR